MEKGIVSMVEEDAPVYNIQHRAFYFSKEVILMVKDQKFEKLFSSVFDQLVRSATSIGANLVESSAGSSKNDFLKFHIIALKSANETKYWLSLIKETMNIEKGTINRLINEVTELSKIIATIIIRVRAGKN